MVVPTLYSKQQLSIDIPNSIQIKNRHEQDNRHIQEVAKTILGTTRELQL
jgi:hypothetical protein